MALAALLGGPDDLGEVFEIDLVADAGARRHDAEIVEGGLAPAQEGVALAVALELVADVVAEGVGLPKLSTITEWSMTRSTGESGLILLGVAAELRHRLAHGGEIDHRRHAGEILHQHPRRAERDLALGGAASSATPPPP